jgi:hypothetical protein
MAMRLVPLTSLLSGLFLGACSVFGIRGGTEEPRFSLIGQMGPVEIRRYEPRVAAETTIDGSEMAARSTGFRRLAGYIFGGNTGGAKIAMTAPVGQTEGAKIAKTAPVAQTQGTGGSWTIRFYLPASVTQDTAPQPNDPNVKIVPVPAETVAVLRYSGIPSSDAVAAHQAALLNALKGSQWKPDGEPLAWFYDPPWTLPPLRRNEAAVKVVDAGP